MSKQRALRTVTAYVSEPIQTASSSNARRTQYTTLSDIYTSQYRVIHAEQQ